MSRVAGRIRSIFEFRDAGARKKTLGGGVLAGMLSGDVGIEVRDDFHVPIDVPRGEDGGSYAADFSTVIEVPQDDGYIGARSDVIESAFPFSGFFARAFGGDNEDEILVIAEYLYGLIHNVVGAASIDGHAAAPSHERAKWSPKEAVLHHPIGFHSEPEGDTDEKWRVPVARMGGRDDDVFVEIG